MATAVRSLWSACTNSAIASSSADPVRGLRGRNHSAGIIICRMADVLKLAECINEPLHRWPEQLAVLVQVTSGIAVVHPAVCAQLSVLAASAWNMA